MHRTAVGVDHRGVRRGRPVGLREQTGQHEGGLDLGPGVWQQQRGVAVADPAELELECGRLRPSELLGDAVGVSAADRELRERLEHLVAGAAAIELRARLG